MSYNYPMWCFAIINGRLAEVYFEKSRGKVKFHSHCYVKRSEYKTRAELQAIDEDIKKVKLSYRNGVYRDIRTKKD